MNLFSNDALHGPIALLLSALLGTGFGFWLERAGFGSSRKLTAIFYLQDFAVLKVMFAAMATAAVVLHTLAAVGALELGQLFTPPSVLLPQALGGLVFGIGFVVGGYCPGTAAVGLASGHFAAFLFLLGAGLGSLGFAYVTPLLGELTHGGSCDVGSVPQLLGIGGLPTALGLAAIAVFAFVLASRIERTSAGRQA